jgi:tetratricopeptide (TPR) repeat protein
MEWSTNNGEAVKALRIGGSLGYYWFAHPALSSEWNDRIQQALSYPKGLERTLARAKALNGIGFMYWADMYPTDKRSEMEEALSIGRELGDQRSIATALRNLGLLASMQGNYVEARSFLERSLEIWRLMGSDGRMGGSWTLMFLGDVALNQDAAEAARSLYEESFAILREHGNMNFLAYAVRRLGLLAWRDGDHKKAWTLCKESLILNQEVGDPRGVLACLAGFAIIAATQGMFAHAAQLMSAVETQLLSIGIRLLPVDKMEYERNLARLRAKMDEKALATFWTKGKEMTMQQAIAFALEEDHQ